MDVHDSTPFPDKTIELFWSKVDRSGGPDACWPWVAQRGTGGYGRVTVGGRNLKAHRVSYKLANGSVPVDLDILHHCDNPPCCNPAHLWAGTHTENMADMWAKGRGPSGDKSGARRYPERMARHGASNAGRGLTGESNPNARLVEAQVRAIFQALARGQYYRHVAAEYGVSPTLVRKIRSGEVWGHLSLTCAECAKEDAE